jgi:hypothetical protein
MTLANGVVSKINAELGRLEDSQDKEDIAGLMQDFEEAVEALQSYLQGSSTFNDLSDLPELVGDINDEAVLDSIDDKMEEISDMFISILAISFPEKGTL